jgi:iron uptake system EfeUOB component EfeO/EfeM
MNIKENKLHQIAARFISNLDIDANVKGSSLQIETLNSLLQVSKDLLSELKKNEKSLDKILCLTETKKKLTKKFQNLTGFTWML